MTSTFVSTPSFTAESCTTLYTLYSALCTWSLYIMKFCVDKELAVQVSCVLQVPCTLCDMLR